MNKKAFTLIEITAVIVILGLVFLFSYPTLENILKKQEAAKENINDEIVIEAAKTYLNINKNEYDFTVGNNLVVSIDNLKKSDLLDDILIKEKDCVSCEIKDNNILNCRLIMSATGTLLKKANDESVTTYVADSEASKQMYTFTHELTEPSSDLTEVKNINSTFYKLVPLNYELANASNFSKDYRYIGSNPYNYLTFNNESWRIIGIFEVEDEKGNLANRIKIIRDESIGEYAYDTNGINDWSNATLNAYLNDDYYNSLNSSAKKMIGQTKYYLGGIDNYKNLSGPDYYDFERGSNVYEGNSTTWVGNIALIYPSDYVYTYANGIHDICFSDGSKCADSGEMKVESSWLYNFQNQRLLSHNSKYTDVVFIVYPPTIGAEKWNGHYNISFQKNVRPTVYLKETVQIIDGDGSKDNPYQLSI